MSAIESKGISMRYGQRLVLRDFSLRVEPAERVVLLGPSGCGKTTVLRLVAGFIAPDEGAITINDEVVAVDGRILKAPEARGIGMVFQDLALWPHMTVEGNLAFGLKAQGIPRAEREARIAEALRRVHLERCALAKPAELSGASSSGWRLPARWSWSHGFYSWTNRCRVSISS
jgi:iron(III) transport system ATP-binding protein